MANSLAGINADKPELLWVHLDDFSSGVYDASYVTRAEPIVPAPLGAANAEETFCCASLPGGGLGPLPKLTHVGGYSPSFPSGVTTIYMTGMIVNPGLQNGDTEIVVMLESDSGSTHYFTAASYALTPTFSTESYNIIETISASTQPGIFGSPYPTWTRGRITTPTTKPGSPILVFPAAFTHDTHGNRGHVFVYPSQLAPTTFTCQDLVQPTVTTTGIAGQVVCYSNRILTLAGIDYTWPTGGGISTNENIDFTTPPNGLTLSDQDTVLVAEFPWGYGAAGSISTGELLLVKKEGGGVVVNGDIANPASVIYLPGIMPTGDFYGHTGASDIGLFYCSEGRGAYLWNGGNASQKISNQLRDDFFDCQTGVIDSNNYGFFVERWGQFMLFSNNYIYNTLTGSWWVLYPNATNGSSQVTGHTIFHWSQGVRGYQMWGAPLRFTSSNRDWLFLFDNRYAAQHWQWQSLPIHVVPTADHVVDVRQVVVRASCPNSGSTVKVTIGSWSATSNIAIGTTPTPIRFNVGMGALGLDDIVVTLNGDQTTATDSSPIIHSVDVGYRVHAHTPVDN